MLTEICSRHALLGLLGEAPGRYDLLLVTNPWTDAPEGVPELARRALHLRFEDVTEPAPGVRPPTEEDVRAALEWSAGCGDLVVACHAGVSRSAALAYVIRCHDWSPRQALQVLTPGWHQPNRLIVRLGAELLGSPDVYGAYLAWMRTARPRAGRR